MVQVLVVCSATHTKWENIRLFENSERVQLKFLRVPRYFDMAVDVFPWTKSKPRKTQPLSVAGTRRHKCGQAHTNLSTHTNQGSFPNMAFSPCFGSPIISLLVHFLLVVSTLCPVHSSQFGNQTFRPKEELRKWNAIRNRLQQINKPPVKTIQVCANYYSIHLVLFSRPCYIINMLCVFMFLLCRVLMEI